MRWALCNRNTFLRSPQFTRDTHLVFCALHNILEARHVEYIPGQVANMDAQAQGQALVHAHPGGNTAQGVALRERLTTYLSPPIQLSESSLGGPACSIFEGNSIKGRPRLLPSMGGILSCPPQLC